MGGCCGKAVDDSSGERRNTQSNGKQTKTQVQPATQAVRTDDEEERRKRRADAAEARLKTQKPTKGKRKFSNEGVPDPLDDELPNRQPTNGKEVMANLTKHTHMREGRLLGGSISMNEHTHTHTHTHTRSTLSTFLWSFPSFSSLVGSLSLLHPNLFLFVWPYLCLSFHFQS